MAHPGGYYYPNYSLLFRALEKYFRGRGAPESKLSELVSRWIHQKGYRLPQVLA